MSGEVIGVALIGDRHADSKVVEYPVIGAFQAALFFPVPGGASEVGRSGVVGARELANSTEEEIVAIVAGSACTSSIPGSAVVGDRGTFLSVEEVSFRALQADVAFGVPKTASKVRWLLHSRLNTGTISEFITSKASEA